MWSIGSPSPSDCLIPLLNRRRCASQSGRVNPKTSCRPNEFVWVEVVVHAAVTSATIAMDTRRPVQDARLNLADDMRHILHAIRGSCRTETGNLGVPRLYAVGLPAVPPNAWQWASLDIAGAGIASAGHEHTPKLSSLACHPAESSPSATMTYRLSQSTRWRWKFFRDVVANNEWNSRNWILLAQQGGGYSKAGIAALNEAWRVALQRPDRQ